MNRSSLGLGRGRVLTTAGVALAPGFGGFGTGTAGAAAPPDSGLPKPIVSLLVLTLESPSMPPGPVKFVKVQVGPTPDRLVVTIYCIEPPNL